MAMGRQKIKVARIEKFNRRQVTFSKRCSGLFKKASELCTLFSVEMAIVVFSPGGKAFSFGCPNVDTLIDRFLTQSSMPSSSEQMPRNVGVEEGLNGQLTMLLKLLEIKQKRGEELDNRGIKVPVLFCRMCPSRCGAHQSKRSVPEKQNHSISENAQSLASLHPLVSDRNKTATSNL